MATHEVDQKLLGRLAKRTAPWSPIVASHLYRLLGLSMILNQHLIRARRQRNLDKDQDQSSIDLIHHIIFLAREGLSCTESYIMPLGESPGATIELRVFAAKLRASFFHIFCLYRNSPPLRHVRSASRESQRTVKARALNSLSLTHQKSNTQLSKASTPSITPKPSKSQPLRDEADKENDPRNVSDSSSNYSRPQLDKDLPAIPTDSSPRPPSQADSISPPTPRRTGVYRDTISSIVSDSSFVTNPYAAHRPSIHDTLAPPAILRGEGTLRDPVLSALSEASYITNPYAAIGDTSTPPTKLPYIASPSNFLLPSHDYVPQTLQFFSRASSLARTHLSGCAPLRLSVACEYATFLGDCMGDWKGAREVARRAVSESHKAWVQVGGEEFDDSMPFVAFLVRLAEG